MDDLRDLYQDVILDHSKNPRNTGRIAGGKTAVGHNPLCGDKLVVSLLLENGVIQDVKFEGEGCAISQAAASMMTQVLKGKSVEETDHLFERYHDLVTGQVDPSGDVEDLGKLAVFSGVSEFPVRVKCASLAWHTMQAALHEKAESITTE